MSRRKPPKRPPNTVLFTLCPVVRVHIQGWKDERPSELCRQDGGLLDRFHDWAHEHKIHPRYGDSSGGGSHIGYYEALDAERIRIWLSLQSGVTRSDWELDKET